MNASVVDLRYKMNDVLKALDRNEDVTILYHGKVKGVLKSPTKDASQKVTDHPFFSMANSEEPVDSVMQQLRGGRFNDNCTSRCCCYETYQKCGCVSSLVHAKSRTCWWCAS